MRIIRLRTFRVPRSSFGGRSEGPAGERKNAGRLTLSTHDVSRPAVDPSAMNSRMMR